MNRFVGWSDKILVVAMSMSSKCRSFLKWTKVSYRSVSLLYALAKRDVAQRYQGSLFGALWLVVLPLLMMCIYTFVFGVVFKGRWAPGREGTLEFALLLYCGILVFNYVSDCVSRAPTIIVANANYVKRVVFPVGILPLVPVVSGLANLFLGFLVWLLLRWVLVSHPPATVLFFPALFVPMVLYGAGVSWMLSAVGAYVRDLSNIVPMAITALMFLSPIFYPLSAVPDAFRWVSELNPLVLVLEGVRGAFYFGVAPDGWDVLKLWTGSAIFALSGWLVFLALRRGFAELV